jgi:hypothetical protein
MALLQEKEPPPGSATLRGSAVGSPTVARRIGCPPLRELIGAWFALTVVGGLAFAPHVLHGGFYLDDWSNGAGALRPPGGPSFDHALSYFANTTLYRPVLVLYVPLTYFVFGTHMAYQLAWAASLAILVAGILYGILRTLGVPWVHAWLVAALTIIYPWFDSTRFWATADQATLSIVFASAGLWLAFIGLQRHSWRWHSCAALLYLLSILTYEITLPLIAGFGVLYCLRTGWRAAKARWAIDLLVVVVGGLWVGTQTNHESYGISADFTHLREIITAGGAILGRTLVPVGTEHTTLALIAVALALIAGLAVLRAPRTRSLYGDGWGLRSWLLLAAGGLFVAVLGWTMFIPANPYYTPSVYGVTNRVNALAGFGLVITVYAVFGVVGALVGRLRPTMRALPGLTIILGLLLGVAYVKVLEHHSKIWNAAYRAEEAGIGEMRMQFPKLPPGTTVFVSNYPAYQTLGVPIFSSSWDVNGMIKLQYKDGTLSAYPVIAGLSLVCRADGVGLQGAGAPTITAPYGTAQLLDVGTGRHSRPGDERECQAVAASYAPGPLYLSLTY